MMKCSPISLEHLLHSMQLNGGNKSPVLQIDAEKFQPVFKSQKAKNIVEDIIEKPKYFRWILEVQKEFGEFTPAELEVRLYDDCIEVRGQQVWRPALIPGTKLCSGSQVRRGFEQRQRLLRPIDEKSVICTLNHEGTVCIYAQELDLKVPKPLEELFMNELKEQSQRRREHPISFKVSEYNPLKMFSIYQNETMNLPDQASTVNIDRLKISRNQPNTQLVNEIDHSSCSDINMKKNKDIPSQYLYGISNQKEKLSETSESMNFLMQSLLRGCSILSQERRNVMLN